MKKLIVYFSRNHQNYVNGAIVELAVGNTEVIAKKLQKLTGAELFKIEPVQEYAHDYQTCILQAKEDLKRDARPELKAYPESLDTYDTIYLGYPNYWGTMPMAVRTFLEHFDFVGKTIRPFCTHEGSGMGKSERDIQRLCPSTRVERGLAIQGSSDRCFTHLFSHFGSHFLGSSFPVCQSA